MEILQADLIKVLAASLGGCLLKYLVDYKDGKVVHFWVCVLDCIAAVFLGYYAYLYVIEEMHISILHAAIINIVVGYVGADGVNIAKAIIMKKVNARFGIATQEKENEKPN